MLWTGRCKKTIPTGSVDVLWGGAHVVGQLLVFFKELLEVRRGWNMEQFVRLEVAKNMEWSFIIAAPHYKDGVLEIMS